MIPKPPSHLLRRLRMVDSRLSVRFNAMRRLWEVVEWLPRRGQWSHVLTWHGGSLMRPTYRPLPDSAEPLLRAISERDWARYGGRKGAWQVRQAGSRPADKRIERVERNRKEIAYGLRQYAAWGRRNLRSNQRLYFSGSIGARNRAVAERLAAFKDSVGA